MPYDIKNASPPDVRVRQEVWFWDMDRQDVSFGTVRSVSSRTGDGGTRVTTQVDVLDAVTGYVRCLTPDRVWPDEKSVQAAYAAARAENVKAYLRKITDPADLLAVCLTHDMTRTHPAEAADLREAVIQKAIQLGTDPDRMRNDPVGPLDCETEGYE